MLKVIVFSNYNDHFLKVYNRHLFITIATVFHKVDIFIDNEHIKL